MPFQRRVLANGLLCRYWWLLRLVSYYIIRFVGANAKIGLLKYQCLPQVMSQAWGRWSYSLWKAMVNARTASLLLSCNKSSRIVSCLLPRRDSSCNLSNRKLYFNGFHVSKLISSVSWDWSNKSNNDAYRQKKIIVSFNFAHIVHMHDLAGFVVFTFNTDE